MASLYLPVLHYMLKVRRFGLAKPSVTSAVLTSMLLHVQVPSAAPGAFEITVIDPVKQGDTMGVGTLLTRKQVPLGAAIMFGGSVQYALGFHAGFCLS